MTKVLVVEDESLLRTEVVEWLTFEGYDAAGAKDGMAGLEAIQRQLPDVILCDITMPRMDGHDLLLEMQANSTTAQIPFIFMTARSSHEDIRKGMSEGADDYVTKPFTRRELLDTVQRRLDKKLAQEQQRQAEVEEIQSALAAEHEQRLLQSKMAAMFSHDFRNGLAAILAISSLLRLYGERIDEERRRKHLSRIEESAHNLVQMLEDMLVVAQMDNSKLDFKPEPTNIGDFFQDIVDEFSALDGNAHPIMLENHCDQWVIADPRLLRQIASNLISNALKYSPSGSQVSVFLEQDAESKFVLRVQDHGIGIPADEQKQMFEPFQRASNVGRVNGTGLGLAITKQAVDLHQGSIRLQSHAGVGTTIVVSLPA